MKKILTSFLILFLVFGALGLVMEASAYEEEELDMKALISCLEKEGVVIYGTKWCPACNNLVDEFGGREVISSIYVECTTEEERCEKEKETRFVPEIQIKGEIYAESRKPTDLATEVDCEDLDKVSGKEKLPDGAEMVTQSAEMDKVAIYRHLKKGDDLEEDRYMHHENDYYEIYKLNRESGETIRLNALDYPATHRAELYISPDSDSVIRAMHETCSQSTRVVPKGGEAGMIDLLNFDDKENLIRLKQLNIETNVGSMTWSEDSSKIAYKHTALELEGPERFPPQDYYIMDVKEKRPVFINHYDHPHYFIDSIDIEKKEVGLISQKQYDYPDKSLSLSYFLDENERVWQVPTDSYENEKFDLKLEHHNESNVTYSEPAEGRFRLKVRYPGEEWFEPSRLEIENNPRDKEEYRKSAFFSPYWEDPVQKITFERDGEKFYATCVDYKDIGIIDFCNKTVETLETMERMEITKEDSEERRRKLLELLRLIRMILERD